MSLHNHIEQLKDLHCEHTCKGSSYKDCFILFGRKCGKVGLCTECGKPYPCPTRQILDEIQDPIGYCVLMSDSLPTWVKGGDIYEHQSQAEAALLDFRASIRYAPSNLKADDLTLAVLTPVRRDNE